MVPFDYPAESHARRHGPQGYADYESYRPWLRDEFTFRCVYCLQRERWGQVSGTYHIDHLDGSLEGLTDAAQSLIARLDLDSPPPSLLGGAVILHYGANLHVFRSPPSLLGGSNDWSFASESDRITRSAEQARRGRGFSGFLG